jgi:hypothetical protein
MRRFNAGDAPDLRQYLLVVTPRALEHQRTPLGEFDGNVREMLRSLGKPPPEGDFAKYLETRRPAKRPTSASCAASRKRSRCCVACACRRPTPACSLPSRRSTSSPARPCSCCAASRCS